jgi:hypothetical protein
MIDIRKQVRDILIDRWSLDEMGADDMLEETLDDIFVVIGENTDDDLLDAVRVALDNMSTRGIE